MKHTISTTLFLSACFTSTAYSLNSAYPTEQLSTFAAQLTPLPTSSNINLYYSSAVSERPKPLDISPLPSKMSDAMDDDICVWNMDRRTLGLLPEISTFLQYVPPVYADNDTNQPLFIVSDKPPAGFESLDEPQTSLLDVYYNGRPLGTLPATYTLTSVTFLQPAQLGELIPGVKDKAAVAQAFAKALPAHADLVCSDKLPTPVCSLPMSNDVAVVFDVNKYRADVFVNPNLLLPNFKESDLLGPSSTGLALEHDMNLAVAGSNTSGSSSYNFSNQGSLANGSARLNYQVSLSQTGSSNNNAATPNTNNSPTQLTLQQLNAEWDHNRYLFQMGYIETIGDTFIGNQNILGVSAGTSLNTLLQDKKSAYGSPLIIFLALPSQVSIYRDNRLLVSGFYPAGQQVLDTSSLPIGSYPVTLKIQDNLGATHEETQFFTKTQDLPPKEYPLYYTDVGYLTNINTTTTEQNSFLPTTSSTPVAQAGINKRIGSNWGITTSGIASTQNGYLSGGFFILLPYYQWQLKPELVVGSDNDYGVALTSRAQIGKAQFALNARQIWAKDSQNNNAINDNSTFDPLLQGQSQVNFNLGFPIKGTLINLITQWSKTNDSTNYSYGVNSRSTLHRFRSSYLELTLSASRSSTETLLALATLNWNFTSKKFSHRISSSYTHDQSTSNNTGPTLAIDSYWRNYDAAQEGLQLKAGVAQSPAQQTANVGLDDFNTYSRIVAQTQYTKPIGQDNNTDSSAVTQYNGNIESRLIWAEDARPSLGMGRNQAAGVVVYIDSDQPGQEFQVLTGPTQVVKVVKTNEFTPLFLDAYRSYELRIKAVSNDFFKYDERPRQVTLYPGNYQYLSWKARQKLVIFTQVLMQNKKPFSQARLENGTDFNYTDEQGYIQLEIFKDTREVDFVQASGDRCRVHLPEKLPIENGFTSLDSVICTPLPKLAATEQPSSEESAKNAVIQSGLE